MIFSRALEHGRSEQSAALQVLSSLWPISHEPCTATAAIDALQAIPLHAQLHGAEAMNICLCLTPLAKAKQNKAKHFKAQQGDMPFTSAASAATSFRASRMSYASSRAAVGALACASQGATQLSEFRNDVHTFQPMRFSHREVTPPWHRIRAHQQKHATPQGACGCSQAFVRRHLLHACPKFPPAGGRMLKTPHPPAKSAIGRWANHRA